MVLPPPHVHLGLTEVNIVDKSPEIKEKNIDYITAGKKYSFLVRLRQFLSFAEK